MTHAPTISRPHMVDPSEKPLAKETAAYERMLPVLMNDEGKFALIFGDNLIGVFAAYDEALRAGYEKAKLAPFLVRRISGAETLAYFSRDIDHACRISV
jgi:hypothetical protein